MSGRLRVQVFWDVMVHHWMRLYCLEMSSHSVMMQHHIPEDQHHCEIVQPHDEVSLKVTCTSIRLR